MRIAAARFEIPNNLTKVQRTLWNLREDMKLGNVLGDHDRYLSAHRAFMKEFVTHPKDGLTLPPTAGFTAPLFSRTGLNMLKVLIKELFRKRTPEEKELGMKMKEIMQNRRYYV